MERLGPAKCDWSQMTDRANYASHLILLTKILSFMLYVYISDTPAPVHFLLTNLTNYIYIGLEQTLEFL